MNLLTLVKLLDEECRTRISIERIHAAFAESEDLKLTPEQPLHHSAYCRERKLSDDNLRCAGNKKRSLEIARLGRSFCGRFPWLFAAPVLHSLLPLELNIPPVFLCVCVTTSSVTS